MTQLEDRLPLHDRSNEMCVLGALMLCGDDKDTASEIFSACQPEDFYDPDYGELFKVAQQLHREGQSLDGINVRTEMLKLPSGNQIAMPHLAEMIQSVPSHVSGIVCAKAVREDALRRRAIRDASEAVRLLYDRSQDYHETVARLADLAFTDSRGKIGVHHIEQVVWEMWDRFNSGGVPGIESSYPSLAKLIGKYGKGEMCVMAGRPSMGKSLSAKDEIRGMAKRGIKCGIIPLEEPRIVVANKYLAAEGSLDADAIRDGSDARVYDQFGNACGYYWDDARVHQLNLAVNRMAQLPIWVSDAAFGVSEAVSTAEYLVRKHGCEVIVWDHMHLMDGPGKSSVEKVSQISNALKRCIRRLDIVGIVVAQLNRLLTQRDDKRPVMSDLKESGTIEQDADIIILLHREDYYRKKGVKRDGMIEFIVAKRRNGITGSIDLKFNDRFQRIEEPTPVMGLELGDCPV